MTIEFRAAKAEDVDSMLQCREMDPASPVGYPRAAYFAGEHHPQHALAPRIGYVALTEEGMAGYIAGHLTTRHRCDGEIQYLFVASAYRRAGIAKALVGLLGRWFVEQGAFKICVNVDLESPPAKPFYCALGAAPLASDKPYWYVWPDARVLNA